MCPPRCDSHVGGSVPQVLLCASNQNNSIVECWSLRKEGLPVNNIFQQISPVGKCLHWGLLRTGAWSEEKSSTVSHIHYPIYGIIQNPMFIFRCSQSFLSVCIIGSNFLLFPGRALVVAFTS